MGLLYDVLFKPIGRDGGVGSTTTPAAARTVDAAATADDAADREPPVWVLDRRDGGSLVWRRHGPPSRAARKRVEFLDAVQVRVFERDECDGDDVRDEGAAAAADDDDDGWFRRVDDGSGPAALSEAWADKDDYPALVVVSVTVVGLCIGLAYLFAPVRWLLHHVLLQVDD